MTPQMKNRSLGAAANTLNSTKSGANYSTKKFPPFGKKLDDHRRQGLIPAMRVIVTTDWKLGAAYPRIVVTRDQPITSLRFEYLAGLHVQIVYYDHDASILPNLTAEIQSVNPASLAVFNMSAVKRGEPAYTMIYLQSVMEEIAA